MKKYLDLIVVCLFALMALAALAIAKPTTPEPPKKADKYQYPDLNYESNWGKMTIDRNSGEIILREHPLWDGDAKFVTATKVYVVWYWKENGNAAPGIYDLEKDGTLVGVWNWDKDIYIDEKTWEAVGDLRADKIQPVQK